MAKNHTNPQSQTDRRRLNARGLRLGIVVSRFNSVITDALLEGALQKLAELGAERTHVTVTKVPGAFELPQAANILLQNGDYDAIICLGCVIRGETSHFEYICQSCATALQTLSLQAGVPVIFGVLTTETLKQAEERCGGAHGHKGKDCAEAAVEMALFTQEQKTALPLAIVERTRNIQG